MIFVFKVRIKPGHTIDEYVEAWSVGSTFFQRCMGAMGTRLYQHTDEPNTLLAIATWNSKADRDAAWAELSRDDHPQRATLDLHETIADIEVIGHFDGPMWEVSRNSH